MAVENDTIHVLHVDDEPGFATMTVKLLEREDDRFDVDPYTDPKDVPSVLQEHAYDCVISDYEMPGCDGLELLEIVRAEWPNIPFFLFTGKGDEEIARQALDAGVTDYLHKGTGTAQYTILAHRIVHAVQRNRAILGEPIPGRTIDAASTGVGLVEHDGTFSSGN